MQIDVKKLRKDLEDYYGTAMFNGNRAAVIDISRIVNLNDEEIPEVAKKIGLNLDIYRVGVNHE